MEVWPPTEPEWRDSAVRWLLDQAPPEWRLLPVLRRYPQVLAWLTVGHLDGQLQAARAAWTGLPHDPQGHGDAGAVVGQVRELLAEVGPQLARRLRAAQYLEAALADARNAP